MLELYSNLSNIKKWCSTVSDLVSPAWYNMKYSKTGDNTKSNITITALISTFSTFTIFRTNFALPHGIMLFLRWWNKLGKVSFIQANYINNSWSTFFRFHYFLVMVLNQWQNQLFSKFKLGHGMSNFATQYIAVEGNGIEDMHEGLFVPFFYPLPLTFITRQHLITSINASHAIVINMDGKRDFLVFPGTCHFDPSVFVDKCWKSGPRLYTSTQLQKKGRGNEAEREWER